VLNSLLKQWVNLNQGYRKKSKLTTPSGRQSIWLEPPNGIKNHQVSYEARKMGISRLTGLLCTSFVY
jgi:hypothetical protein